MISNSVIKQVKLLHQKKYREENRSFIAEGPKVVGELLRSKYKVKEIFAVKGYKLSSLKIPLHEISESELSRISALTSPNQVLGVFEIPETKLNKESLKDKLILALDDIRDPGNLGTIIRIADWFGVETIICSENSVDLFNPKVVQATMGSIARVKVYYEELEGVLKELGRSMPVYGSSMAGQNIYEQELSFNGVILIGNESQGVSENLLKLASQKIAIPRFSEGAESLNAAVATAIICSEFRRRKK